jgi:hypothetical protein
MRIREAGRQNPLKLLIRGMRGYGMGEGTGARAGEAGTTPAGGPPLRATLAASYPVVPA